ncbi:MAG: hypothetical protein ABI977_27845 [Acidobacteriota bacterium]
MKRLVSVIGVAVLLASALMAAEDLTGKWSGSFIITMDGETKDDVAYMVLKQSGTELTGTAGPSTDQQWAIQKGKIEGNKITFEVQSDGPLLKFELALADGHLKGDAKAEHDGHSMKAAVDVQRQKE